MQDSFEQVFIPALIAELTKIHREKLFADVTINLQNGHPVVLKVNESLRLPGMDK